jgi:F-box and WD-40 domain protein CDC4
MWNVRNGECVRDLLTDLSGVWQVRFDERRCVAAVQRNNLTYIEVSSIRLLLVILKEKSLMLTDVLQVLDFGASRDGVPDSGRGRRIVVDHRGAETEDVDAIAAAGANEADNGATD